MSDNPKETSRVLIAGCGYLGTSLAKRLARGGAAVWGLRRRAASLDLLHQQGLTSIQADLLNPAGLRALPQVNVAVLCQAPSRDQDNYGETYLRGTENLLENLARPKPARVIFVSSTSVYPQRDGSWVDEATPIDLGAFDAEADREKAAALLAAEKKALEFKPAGIVLRLGGLYGPSRHRALRLKKGGEAPRIGDKFTNRIHVEDAVSAICTLIEKGKDGQIYLGVDDLPATEKEFYEWLCDRFSLPSPVQAASTPGESHGKRCSNRKLKDLDWKPRYPDFRSGYREFLREIL